jgi:hypothetical protein
MLDVPTRVQCVVTVWVMDDLNRFVLLPRGRVGHGIVQLGQQVLHDFTVVIVE